MMLSSADFEDLFPHLFGPARPEIARWEDDGGSRIGVGSLGSKSGSNLVKSARAYLPPPHAQAVLIAMRVGAAWAKPTEQMTMSSEEEL